MARMTFCGDDELGYLGSRTPLAEGAGMELDRSYRAVHLPLIRPESPLALPRAEGRERLVDGRHPTEWSVVLPVDPDALEASPAMGELERALRTASFADKIAWDLLPRRREVLHATVCGGYGESPAPQFDAATLAALREVGPTEIELRGLFSGNRNVGRLYLKVYPESRAGTNPLRLAQRALGRPETDLWLVGIWNLTDDLTPSEAAELQALLDRWWDVPLLRFTATRLWLLGARDDLVLDGDPPRDLALAAPPS
jgi:hypothetical protein